MPRPLCPLVAFVLLCASAVAAVAAGLPNPGFEEGLSGWVAKDTMSQVLPEAARSGKAGLRITDNDTAKGSDLTSAKIPVTPGQALTLGFYAKAQGDFAAVYLRFQDAAGGFVKDEARKYTGGMPAAGVKKGAGAWTPYTLKATVPEGAATVAVWIHSWAGATGTADFDDFELAGVAADARPVIGAQSAVAAPTAAV
ncbi:MAG TPA: carbohydrate binding domain-containing protein, partial [Rariglobus sp.]